MLEKVIYENSYGEKLYLGIVEEDSEIQRPELYVNETDLRDFSWEVNTKNNQIQYFSREIEEKKLPIMIAAGNDQRGKRLRNLVYEVTEKDVLRQEPGKIWIGDYYLECYVTKSSKSEYVYTYRYAVIELTITTNSPYWKKEESYHFQIDGEVKNKGLDYDYDFMYDYGGDVRTSSSFLNHTIYECDFELTIHGPTKNPTVLIEENRYSADIELQSGQDLVINSKDKTVLLKKNGEYENIFWLRNRDAYIFEKIDSGVNQVQWIGDFKWDIVLYLERSEPEWI